jgi:hypothetical protein
MYVDLPTVPYITPIPTPVQGVRSREIIEYDERGQAIRKTTDHFNADGSLCGRSTIRPGGGD